MHNGMSRHNLTPEVCLGFHLVCMYYVYIVGLLLLLYIISLNTPLLDMPWIAPKDK